MMFCHPMNENPIDSPDNRMNFNLEVKLFGANLCFLDQGQITDRR